MSTVSIVDQSSKTRAWCRKNQFSGLRRDPVLENCEIWIMGKMAKEVSKVAIAINPRAIAEAYEEAFGLHPGTVILE